MSEENVNIDELSFKWARSTVIDDLTLLVIIDELGNFNYNRCAY